MSLNVLADTQPDGRPPLVYAGDLTDSWGKPYEYDPTDIKNSGNQPDTWTQTPHGKVIGNWPGGP